MEFAAGLGSGVLGYVLPFLAILTAVVFVHELGHYWVARRCGVRVEVFSVGFGSELFGWTDRAGTRWKISVIPLGGDVKFLGDRDAASRPDAALADQTPEQRAHSFPSKSVGQRAAIVAAGPIANFIFAILVFAAVFATAGEPYTPPVIGGIEPGGAAERAGLAEGDAIVEMNGRAVVRFEDIRQIVQLGLGAPLAVVIERGGERRALDVTPDVVEIKDSLGNVSKIGRLGIKSKGYAYVRHDPATAAWRAVIASWSQADIAYTAVSQMIAGTRTTQEIGGPMRIAWISGEVAQAGILAAITFTAILSVHLGIINLLPVPMLDGGHLLFYVIEALKGKPLSSRAQEYGFRIGLALVMLLFLFATWNDLVHLRIVQFIQGLMT